MSTDDIFNNHPLLNDVQIQRLKETLQAVALERVRQESLKKDGRFKWTCADAGLDEFQALAVLTEEVGEVARALMESSKLTHDRPALLEDDHRVRIMEELVQVAAVALAFAERYWRPDV
jgi:NTP pyrophosphatase (non-canonical NTP hydrolase)